MRIMCDTNVLISGMLFPDSVPGKVLREIARRDALVLPTCVVEELRRVFQNKFPEKIEALDRYLERKEFEVFVTPRDFSRVDMPKIRDENDEPVLASAILAVVDFLITGDKDFMNVEIDRPIVLTPTAFLELLKRIAI